jgi:hypothetical protein
MPSDYSPDPRPQGKAVRVVGCDLRSFSGPRGSQLMAAITLSSGRQLLEPYLLNPLQVHVLVRDLIRVLHSLENQHGEWGGAPTSDELGSPSIPTPPPPRKRHVRRPVLPSRHPSSPTTPIGAAEVGQLRALLENVKHHADFMRFIGAEALPKEFAKRVAKKKQSPDPIGLDEAKTDRKRPRRLRSRNQKRNRRKEK